ncbi:MAG: hypothetical protein BZY87_01080 [SAR202 cluster bacterium Io17-Chloro-G6]|nr:MAG: hypothetical protein BZY87_01080 [SAR202 cluster bacterium Io17-Chloro-G6]
MLLDVRQAAEQVLRHAKSILVIGYSFTENDEYISRMFSRAVEADADKDIFVLDLESAPADRFRQFLTTHAQNFDSDNRIFDFVGDGEETLPLLLQGPTNGLAGLDVGKPKTRKRRRATANLK